MQTRWKAASYCLLAVGVVLGVEGLWGLFSDEVFGLFTINRLRAVLDLLLVGVAIAAAWRGRPLGALTSIGGVLLGIALLWALPVTQEFFATRLAINAPGAIALFVLGVFCLLASSASGVRVGDAELPPAGRRPGGRAGTAH